MAEHGTGTLDAAPGRAHRRGPETREAIANLPEILRVPGIDGILVGPGDLSIALSNGATFDPDGAAVTEALREIVRIRRPDHSDFQCFTPPDLALADSAGDYLWDRYGWKYGVPAYAARFLVSYALSDAKKNHWYDTAASAALAYGFNYALVSRYHERPVRVSFDPEPNGASLHLVIRF